MNGNTEFDMRLSPARLASWLGFGVLLGVACTGPSATTTEGVDTTTEGGECPVGSVGCPCTPGGTCDGSLVCASKICVPLEETTGDLTTTVAPTGDPGTSNDTSVGECAPMNEQENGLCPGDEPYCSKKGECVACGGISSCAAIDPDKPACDATSGRCVACTAQDTSGCQDTTPICDADAMTCRACVAHDECSGSACDLATGACFPADDTLWVDGAGDCDDAGPGSSTEPLCTIAEALSRLDGPRAILVRGAVYGDPLAVPAGAVTAILRVGSAAVEITGTGDAALAIASGARVYLDGLVIRGNTLGSGVGCDGGELWIDRTLVRQHNISGVSAIGCVVRVRASTLTQNLGEGAFVSGGQVALENSFLTENGDKANAENPRGGLALAGGAAAEVLYSSLVGNNAYTGGGLSVECDPDAQAESITIRNSIAFNAVGYSTFNCEGAEVVSHSAFSAASDDPDDDNLGVATADVAMMLGPAQGSPGVYRPKPGTALDTVAQFVRGDPEFDFEGDPRPTGEASFPGADQPPP